MFFLIFGCFSNTELLREGVKKNSEKAVRLTAWHPDPVRAD